MDDKEAARQPRAKNKSERRVARLLCGMGLDFVAANVELRNCPERVVGEVDLVFKSGRILLLVEVSAGRNSVSSKHRNFFGKWGKASNVEALKAQLRLQSTKTLRVYFDLRLRPENLGAPELEGVAGPRTMNRIYYQEDFDRLADGVRRGIITGESFLSGFG